ncbi:hypothetical protein BGX38DRAFT_1207833 [Terfezia claveryi]|nr:hypothetical protein BGX38DRAFT_1207833 [Terfezia claveryi]
MPSHDIYEWLFLNLFLTYDQLSPSFYLVIFFIILDFYRLSILGLWICFATFSFSLAVLLLKEVPAPPVSFLTLLLPF